jgi:hypothetical protein
MNAILLPRALPVLSHQPPRVVGTASSSTTGSASLTINLPPDIKAGDLLVTFVGASGNGRTLSATGWTIDHAADNMSSTGETCMMHKTATGAEGATQAASLSSSADSVHITYLVRPWKNGTFPAAGSNSATPAVIDYGTGSTIFQIRPSLWIVFCGTLYTVLPTVGLPANYRDKVSVNQGTTMLGTSGWRHNMIRREAAEAFSETGGTITGRGTQNIVVI